MVTIFLMTEGTTKVIIAVIASVTTLIGKQGIDRFLNSKNKNDALKAIELSNEEIFKKLIDLREKAIENTEAFHIANNLIIEQTARIEELEKIEKQLRERISILRIKLESLQKKHNDTK